MSKQYDEIVHDEVNYWFDVLQNNSIDNISIVTHIERDKVRKILDERFNKVKAVFNNSQRNDELDFYNQKVM